MKRAETKGYFGQFGGSFIARTYSKFARSIKRQPLNQYKNDPEFIRIQKALSEDYSGQETPALLPGKFDRSFRWGEIYLGEDLNHLGSHKLNNVLQGRDSLG